MLRSIKYELNPANERLDRPSGHILFRTPQALVVGECQVDILNKIKENEVEVR
jgi:hypothetical protein